MEHYIWSIFGFVIAFVYSIRIDKDKDDLKNIDFDFKLFMKRNWENHLFNFLLAIVWAKYGAAIWGSTIEPLVNYIGKKFYDHSKMNVPFYEPYYLLSGVFAWAIYHIIPALKNLFNMVLKKIKGGKK